MHKFILAAALLSTAVNGLILPRNDEATHNPAILPRQTGVAAADILPRGDEVTHNPAILPRQTDVACKGCNGARAVDAGDVFPRGDEITHNPAILPRQTGVVDPGDILPRGDEATHNGAILPRQTDVACKGCNGARAVDAGDVFPRGDEITHNPAILPRQTGVVDPGDILPRGDEATHNGAILPRQTVNLPTRYDGGGRRNKARTNAEQPTHDPTNEDRRIKARTNAEHPTHDPTNENRRIKARQTQGVGDILPRGDEATHNGAILPRQTEVPSWDILPRQAAAGRCGSTQNVTYTVGKGDTLTSIAAKYNSGICDIAAYNNISNVNVINDGAVLVVPKDCTDPDNESCNVPSTAPPTEICVPGVGSSYDVRSGDTLTAISKDFNITLASVIAANPQISNPDLIYPAQIINIPVCAHSTCDSVGTHVVMSGDTFFVLAQNMSTTVGQIKALNYGVDPGTLAVGQQIILPSHCHNVTCA